MNIVLFCHRKNLKLVYIGSRVAKSKASFILDKKTNYLSNNDLKVYIFLMDILRTYQG
jgi:hypothetical protein